MRNNNTNHEGRKTMSTLNQQQTARDAINKAAAMTITEAASIMRTLEETTLAQITKGMARDLAELYIDDACDFGMIAEELERGDVTWAGEYARGLETGARDEIDAATFVFMGGELVHDPRN